MNLKKITEKLFINDKTFPVFSTFNYYNLHYFCLPSLGLSSLPKAYNKLALQDANSPRCLGYMCN